MSKDSLGDRMKGYENVSKSKLIGRMPVIIRIDGKAFHTWTRQLDDSNPFSDTMHNAMTRTTFSLVSNIQNAVFGYTQSDEISILLNDWKTLTTDQWFGGGLQKIASVSASMATAYFNKIISDEVGCFSPAMFDARVFNITREEVVNYFIWRQIDATKNSISMAAQSKYSSKELHKKNGNDKQEMLFQKAADLLFPSSVLPIWLNAGRDRTLR